MNAFRELSSTLTPREHEVFNLVVRGKLNKEIAHDLGTSERTIKAHRHSIMEKMQVKAPAELVLIASQLGMLGATEPGPGVSDWQALLMEFVLTAGLVSTILGTASKAQNLGPISAFGVGAYIILAGLWSSPISGASMNPARSFGPDLVLLDFSHYWVYIVGPIAGGLVAVGIAYVLRGRGGGSSGMEAAQGKLQEIVAENSVQPDGSSETK